MRISNFLKPKDKITNSYPIDPTLDKQQVDTIEPKIFHYSANVNSINKIVNSNNQETTGPKQKSQNNQYSQKEKKYDNSYKNQFNNKK